MIPWVQVYSNLPHHPKIARLADELGLSSAAVGMDTMAVGIVVSLWAWAIQNAYTGDLTDISDRVIAEACRWKKRPETLVKALIAAGWIDADRHIHDWEEYSVLLLDAEDERRQKTAERVRRYRNKKKSAADVTGNANVTVTGNASDTPSNAPTIPDHTIPVISPPTYAPAGACAREEPAAEITPAMRALAAASGNQEMAEGADPGLAKVMSFFLNRINATPSMTAIEELGDFAKAMEPDVIIAAMNYALDEHKTTWSYIRGTLRGYQGRGIRTMGDLQRANDEYERAKQRKAEDTQNASNRRNSTRRPGAAAAPAGADPIRGFHTDD